VDKLHTRIGFLEGPDDEVLNGWELGNLLSAEDLDGMSGASILGF
jgi:hypothetical protein